MSDRIYKVNELIREEVSNILLRELGDHKGFITITAVETTRDMKHSDIWYSLIGADEKEIESLLESKDKAIQQTLNHRLQMKHVPRINFRLDRSGDYADKINKLIREANDDNSKSNQS